MFSACVTLDCINPLCVCNVSQALKMDLNCNCKKNYHKNIFDSNKKQAAMTSVLLNEM